MIEEFQSTVQLDAVFTELHQGLRGCELCYETGRVSGLAAGDFTFLNQNNILPSHLRQDDRQY